ncbi:GntR family transcriptional regulator [Virgibacillus sp. W0181]|uniref:GntR family transcriptional regulator n=1 Tax=Virgibacillus sp. W0181 TaxID=3391581 RepID=UPI003F479F58
MSESIVQESLGEQIADQLRRKIWNRELQFGERLLESELSNNFDVSRSTIREALKILEYEEMVISKARKGTYVSPFSEKDWKEIIELRTLIEAHAFVQALPQLNEGHFEKLYAILEQMKEQLNNSNWSKLFDLDMNFHSYVVNLSGNSRIIKIYDSIQVQIRTVLLHLDEYYSSPQVFYQEHKDLLEALQTNDKDIVRRGVKNHIEYVEEQLIAEH